MAAPPTSAASTQQPPIPAAPSSRAQGPASRIFTVAGNGAFTIAGPEIQPGSRATDVELGPTGDVAVTANGDLLITDTYRVWRLGPDGTLRAAAGNGGYPSRQSVGDGGPALLAPVAPSSLEALPDGGFLFADVGRVRRVWPDGTISTVAGNGGSDSSSGDGGPATAAGLERPTAVAASRDGGFLVLERARVRLVGPDGIIETLAGDGVRGFAGDDGPAVHARIQPDDGGFGGDIAALADGGFLIADTVNLRVRRVWPDGRIATVAGDGRARSGGDGGPAVRASIDQPFAVAALPDGGFLVSDMLGRRIRRVHADGTITTVAGTGVDAPLAVGVPVGDGGPASGALVLPWGRGLVSTRDGGYAFTDFSRVRLVTPGPPRRLELAVTGIRDSRSGPIVQFRSTGAGVVRVVVLRPDGRTMTRAQRRSPAGPASARLGRVRAGRYRLRLSLRGSGGRRASTTMTVLLGRAMPSAAARHAVEYALASDSAAYGLDASVGHCRRMSASRIDCKGYVGADCEAIGAVTLRAGFAFVRFYPCRGGFRQRPRWTGPATPWPVLGTPPRPVGGSAAGHP
jgi:hypothetical protein